MTTIADTLAQALGHHQAGRLAQAEHLYRAILETDPRHVDALQLCGVIAFETGRGELAIQYLREALRFKPDFAEVHNNLANILAAQGLLDEAAAHYRQAIRFKPDYSEVHYNLGNLLRDRALPDGAAECYRTAIRLKPGYVEAHCNLGNMLMSLGKPAEAVDCYREAIRIKPTYAEAHSNLGGALHNLDRRAEAVECYREAIRLKPDFADAYSNLGAALHGLNRYEEAAAAYREGIRLKPDNAEAHNSLGAILNGLGLWAEAAECYREVTRLKPDFAEAHNNRAVALHALGQMQEAMACYRAALRLKPDVAEIHNNLGITLQALGRPAEAAAAFQQALRLKPELPEAQNSLAIALQALGQVADATVHYREAIRVRPDYAEAHNNLGNALREQGRLDEAIVCYRHALGLKPEYLASRGALIHELQHVCDWHEIADQVHRLIEFLDTKSGVAGDAVTPFNVLTLPFASTAALQLQCAHRWVQQRLRPGMPLDQLKTLLPRPKRIPPRIKLGYLSADFRTHPVAQLAAELFERHDRARFEVYGYSHGVDDGSPMRRRLMRAFDHFIDIRNLPAQEAAGRIQQDEVDILVDLSGYTWEARTNILAQRPAPIQVNFLGYPGTMGAPFMDYILVDEFVVPPDQQPFYTEQLVHLPGCYQVNDSRREIAEGAPTRAACGLPGEGFVFCCFNNSYKINAAMFSVWMRILGTTAGSVLWLLEGNRWAPGNLRREAEARGVAGDRLVFAPRVAGAEHLARHRRADLFLDTYPYTAHTTGSDALWAGCPVLTLAGPTFASRVAGSLLRTIGLPELIASNLVEYEAIALDLTRDANKLAQLRHRLQTNRATTSLFDAGRFARNVEKAFETMWALQVAGEKPRAFAVAPTEGAAK